jgi:hypothetical protein
MSILLTSTVNVHPNATYVFQTNVESRIQTYLSSVRKWLTQTRFNIILVENSGYPFHELNEEKERFKERFEVIVFDEKKEESAKFIHHSGSKGRHEIFAIHYAFHHSKLVHTFIIKITARFYIPELESYLHGFPLDNLECLVQNNRNRCEMVGCHVKLFSHIFDIYNINDDHIENVWKQRTSLYENTLVCKEFQIDETQRGGSCEPYTTI